MRMLREILARMRSLWSGASLRPILYGLSVLLTVACAVKPVAGQVEARVPEPLAGPRAEAVDQVRERIRQWMAERTGADLCHRQRSNCFVGQISCNPIFSIFPTRRPDVSRALWSDKVVASKRPAR